MIGLSLCASPVSAQWGRDADVERGELPPPAPAPESEAPAPEPQSGSSAQPPLPAPDVWADPALPPEPQPEWSEPTLQVRPEPDPDWAAPEPQPIFPPAAQPTAPAVSSALPDVVWRGAEANEVAAVLRHVPLPNASPTLQRLIADALAQPGAGDVAPALAKAGAAAALLSASEGDPRLRALALLALGRDDEACALTRNAPAAPTPDKQPDRSPSLGLVAAYCAAAAGQHDAALLSIDLAREAGGEVKLPAAIVKQMMNSGSGDVALPERIDVVDAAFIGLLDSGPDDKALQRAAPLALLRFARDGRVPPERRVAAAERAAALGIADGETLAAAYRAVAADGASPEAKRAALFQAADRAASPAERARCAEALFNSVGEGLLDHAFAQALAPIVASIAPTPELSWFAETGLRITMLAGNFTAAAGWAQLSESPVTQRWRALLSVAAPDPASAEAGLDTATQLALAGALAPDALHRLVTVLDALDRQVPIALWDRASASPQPAGGYLPKTGVLTALKQTADHGEVGLTILLAAVSLGPDGPSRANLIALGDTVRALNKVGLSAEARGLALDALYPLWLASDRAALR